MKRVSRDAYLTRIREQLNKFPVVAILGPRQCGKTTLARTHFAELEYLDLELPSDYDKLSSDPELFLSSRTPPIVIDEAQRFPELFPILRALVDRDRSAGRFILLGSASFSLVSNITESLSGRVGFVDLAPILLPEAVPLIDFRTHWLKGGFPAPLLSGPEDQLDFPWFEAYTRTFIERDLPAIGIDLDARQFRRLWTMCSHFHGHILNKNKLATSLDASPHTVDRYLGLLEHMFILRILPPYYANLKKRLVKSPKLYFRDSGMHHYFRRVLNSGELLTSPERGASFEGYVIEQLIQSAALRADGTEAFFFRTSDELEVDLFLVRGKEIIAFEIKSKLSPGKDDVPGLLKAMELLPIRKGIVIGLGSDIYPVSRNVECMGIEKIGAKLFTKFWQ